MKQNKQTLEVNDRERRVISAVSKLTDVELYGVECFLAGSRAGTIAAEQRRQEQEKAAAVGGAAAVPV